MVTSSIRELSNAMPDASRFIQVAGHSAPGDGGDGLFHWDNSSVQRPNNGTVVKGLSPKGRWLRVFDGDLNVRWFGAKGDGSEATTQIQAALDAASQGGTVRIPVGKYLVTKPLKLSQSTSLIGDGLFSILRYAGPTHTGCVSSKDADKSWAFHLARFNVEVLRENAYGIDLRGMSYSRFDDLHLHLRAPKTSGFFGPGNGSSPYYNVFTGCHIGGTGDAQSNGCIGFD